MSILSKLRNRSKEPEAQPQPPEPEPSQYQHALMIFDKNTFTMKGVHGMYYEAYDHLRSLGYLTIGKGDVIILTDKGRRIMDGTIGTVDNVIIPCLRYLPDEVKQS